MRPIFVRILLNNTTFGVGCRDNVGISKFVIWASVGGLVMILEWVWKSADIFERKILKNTKIGIG